jgi:hypothetical protein
MKTFIFMALVSVALPPMCAQAQEEEQDQQGKLEIRQSQKDLSEEYEKKLAIEKDPDLQYLPMNRFINAGRRK